MMDISKHRSQEKCRNWLFDSALYAWVLSRLKPGPISAIPQTFSGDSKRGQMIRLSDLIATIQSAQSHPSGRKISIDRFLWLADLQASGLQTSAQVARDTTAEWIAYQGQWDPNAWRLDIVAERLCAWLTAVPFLQTGARPDFLNDFSAAIAQQAWHLKFAMQMGASIPQGFGVSKALIYCAVAMPRHAKRLKPALDRLQNAVNKEVLADGGHVSRNPKVQLIALINLIGVRTALAAYAHHQPEWLQSAIDKMTPMLRGFLLGDGHLAMFNGGDGGDMALIETVLKASGTNGRAVTNSPHCGFQRLAARRSLVVMDAGAPENPSVDSEENAGTLSFEFSVAKQRLVVNCGLPAEGNNSLLAAFRSTAAHSTVTVAYMNSSEINAQGYLGPRRAWRTQAMRREIEKNTLVEATHNGYLVPFGLTHKRALFLSSDGNELRGEDTLSGSTAQDAILRFHLHPTVQASLVESGNSILLKFGKTAGWRFRASPAHLKLEPSLYYDQQTRRQTQQIVLAFKHAAPETVIKWRFALEE